LTLKSFVARHASRAIDVPVNDPAVVDDIDTPADYRRVRERFESVSQQELSCQIEEVQA
jgi:CTP:molybdopterin cytidylyltransferase MocA